MRAALLAALAVAAVAMPVAPAAPADDEGPLRLHIAPLPGPTQAVGEAVEVPMMLELACSLLRERNRTLVVEFSTEAPAWVAASAEPPRMYVPYGPSACPGTNVTFGAGMLRVSLRPPGGPPAFEEGAFDVIATADNHTARATVRVRPGFYSILEATTPTSILRARTGEHVLAPVHVTAYGNAPVKVAFEVADAPPGAQLVLPPPLLLAATPDAPANATVALAFTAPDAGVLTNHVGAYAVRLTSWHAENASRGGDTTTLSFLVRTEGAAVPAPGALATIALAVAALAGAHPGARGPKRGVRPSTSR